MEAISPSCKEIGQAFQPQAQASLSLSLHRYKSKFGPGLWAQALARSTSSPSVRRVSLSLAAFLIVINETGENPAHIKKPKFILREPFKEATRLTGTCWETGTEKKSLFVKERKRSWFSFLHLEEEENLLNEYVQSFFFYFFDQRSPANIWEDRRENVTFCEKKV